LSSRFFRGEDRFSGPYFSHRKDWVVATLATTIADTWMRAIAALPRLQSTGQQQYDDNQ